VFGGLYKSRISRTNSPEQDDLPTKPIRPEMDNFKPAVMPKSNLHAIQSAPKSALTTAMNPTNLIDRLLTALRQAASRSQVSKLLNPTVRVQIPTYQGPNIVSPPQTFGTAIGQSYYARNLA